MASFKSTYYFPFLSAVLLHLFLLLLFLHINTKAIPVGNINTRIIHSYVFQYSHIIRKKIKPHHLKSKHIKRTQKQIAKDTKQRAVKIEYQKTMPKNAKSVNQKIAMSNTEGQDQILLKLLHDAINKAQKYPQNAIILGQKGNTQIGFLLHPNGRITDIRIIKSSGFNLLDQAAIAAVQAINPFKHARKYLHKNKWFTIKVAFL